MILKILFFTFCVFTFPFSILFILLHGMGINEGEFDIAYLIVKIIRYTFNIILIVSIIIIIGG